MPKKSGKPPKQGSLHCDKKRKKQNTEDIKNCPLCFLRVPLRLAAGIYSENKRKTSKKQVKAIEENVFFCEIIFLLSEKCDIMGGQSKRLIATLKVAVCFAAIVYVDL